MARRRSSGLTHSVVDLFAGAGGLSLGFERAGYRVMGAVDHLKPAAEAYQQNHAKVRILQQDIGDVVPEVFMGSEIVIGAPPFEPFSIFNRDRRPDAADRLYADHQGGLVLTFIEFVSRARPKAFLLEVVPEFAEEEALMEAALAEFSKAGFDEVFVTAINALDCGVPTERFSVFLSNVPFQVANGRTPPAVGAILKEVREGTPNHEVMQLPEDKTAEVAGLEWGDRLEPISLNGDGEYPNWMRLDPENIAPPIYGFSRFIHPFEDRLLTVREQARLMGVPDHFVFAGAKNMQMEQVGNLTPPALAEAVARGIAATLEAQVPS